MPYSNVPPEKTADMDRCVKAVMAKGHDKERAIAICYSSIVEGQVSEEHLFEAKVTSPEAEGRVWEVTIIGAESPTDVVTFEGREYIRSKNGRLYSCDALRESVPLWQDVRVFDNHLTDAEWEERQGMRSVATEWVGVISDVRWDEARRALVGILKIVDEPLARKLKAAWESGVLNSIGLSVDTYPQIREAVVEGRRLPLIEGFVRINSVDVVAEPAAGGRFTRLIAAMTKNKHVEARVMDPEEIKQLIREEIAAALAELKKPEAAGEPSPEEVVAQVEQAAQDAAAGVANAAPEDASPGDVAQAAAAAITDAVEQAAEEIAEEEGVKEALRRLECQLKLRDRIEAAKLPPALREVVMKAYGNRAFKEAELDDFIKSLKEAQASLDPSGRVQNAGAQRSNIRVGMAPREKLEVEFMRLAMGDSRFRALESNDSPWVKERLTEAHRAWVANGRPRYGANRISQLLYDFLGNMFTGEQARLTEGNIGTDTMATIVKNTVNIMVAADYSQKEEWWQPIVTVEEVETIDDTTLARLYGYSNLAVVEEHQAYTELTADDEEEVAKFVKRGNYIGVSWETLYKDKLNYIRSIPTRLSNAWYNTLSGLVSAVFTVNSAVGPVLSDTGALFNATALTTAGGHANLGTSALSFTTWAAAEAAMMKQTDRPLGAGRRLTENVPKFMLVPVDLRTTGMQIVGSEKIPGSTNNDVNPYYQQVQVLTVPDWTDTNNWAAVADPRVSPAIFLIFLRGNRVPQIFEASDETGGAMFTNDEMRFKVRMATFRFSATYDCAPVADFRGLYKANVTG